LVTSVKDVEYSIDKTTIFSPITISHEDPPRFSDPIYLSPFLELTVEATHPPQLTQIKSFSTGNKVPF
jgi:hypothetical protein